MDPKVQPQPQKVDPNTLQVIIRDPDRVLYSGPAVAVSSKNSVGPFDILPQHENFISLLSDKIVVFKDKHQKEEIQNQSAIVKAKQNKVTIFLGVETLAPNPVKNAATNPQPTPQTNQKISK